MDHAGTQEVPLVSHGALSYEELNCFKYIRIITLRTRPWMGARVETRRPYRTDDSTLCEIATWRMCRISFHRQRIHSEGVAMLWLPESVLSCLACFGALAQCSAQQPAADTEQRDFSILVSGKEAGQSRLTITVAADGTTVVATSIHVRINHIVFRYTLTLDYTEYWKDAKLTALRARGVENSAPIEVEAVSDGSQLTVRRNGVERAAAADLWPASFWKLPDARYHNKTIPVLEPDTGRYYTGQLHYVGTEQLTVLHQPQSCYHFRVSGGSYPVDVWFDRYHRLVRQEFTDTGHKTIVQLVALKR